MALRAGLYVGLAGELLDAGRKDEDEGDGQVAGGDNDHGDHLVARDKFSEAGFKNQCKPHGDERENHHGITRPAFAVPNGCQEGSGPNGAVDDRAEDFMFVHRGEIQEQIQPSQQQENEDKPDAPLGEVSAP